MDLIIHVFDTPRMLLLPGLEGSGELFAAEFVRQKVPE
jgi:hypothetical protein